MIYTTQRPTHMAKRRIDLPDELPMQWSAYREHWPTPQSNQNIGGVVVEGSSKPKAKEKVNG